jgi:hypothetical protein
MGTNFQARMEGSRIFNLASFDITIVLTAMTYRKVFVLHT